MSCSSPIYRLPPDLAKDYGFKAFDSSKGIFHHSKDYFLDNGVKLDDVQALPCGSCFSCRMSYSKEWAVRCMLEASYYEHNYFVTLTYDDANLPTGQFLDFNGEVKDTSLCRRDLVLFIKRFRQHCVKKYNHSGVRVFYCGEYGSSSLTDRPHYHVIFFNCPELDLTFYKSSSEGGYYYHSSDISKTWVNRHKVSLGYHTVSELNFNMCAYTARYMLKKQKGESVRLRSEAFNSIDDSDIQLRSNVFCGMSRKPGIARKYYDDHKYDIYDHDQVLYADDFKVFQSKPPRYFDKLFDIDEPALMEFTVRDPRLQRGKAYSSSVDVLTDAKRREGILQRKESKKSKCI